MKKFSFNCRDKTNSVLSNLMTCSLHESKLYTRNPFFKLNNKLGVPMQLPVDAPCPLCFPSFLVVNQVAELTS